jgi:hypothetical protein
VEVSAALISTVTEAVMEEVKAWQSRPLVVCGEQINHYPVQRVRA